MNKIVCITGMPGAGKSVLSDYFVTKGYQFVRFGQVVLDEILKDGLEPNEENQKMVREKIRKEHGMEAMAKLNLPKFRELLESGDVIADGLYSFSEYKYLKNIFGSQIITVAVFAQPETRYERLSKRSPDENDRDLRNHHFSKEEAEKRDFSEIENIEKGGPIAMADYTLVNVGSIEEFLKQASKLYEEIQTK
jgi:dephospho-CoA kinase